MSVTAYRSSQSVTNGTAGTTVVVTKPAGIVDTGTDPSRDQLIAYIGCTGAPTITAPAGWTLITSIAAGTNVTLAAYRKLASSEGASWTWTLGTSQRNWGWVGAYTGVDPTSPVTATGTDNTLDTSTVLIPTPPALNGHGQGIAAAAATRVASGVATTWTHSSTERADVSTNAGAGNDIAGVVGDTAYTGDSATVYGPTMTASQAQVAGVALALTLNPYFTPYDGGKLSVKVEAAFGQDPDGDLSVASWTDVSAYVLQDPGVQIQVGRPNGTSTADPSRITFTLKNLNGEWTSPTGVYAANLVRNLPFRVRLTGFGIQSAYHRGTAFLASAKPRWDKSLKYAVVDIVAQGRLRRMQRNNPPLHSAAYRTLSTTDTVIQLSPVAYWPLEDQSNATAAASAFPDHPATITGGINFAASSGLYLGSAPMAVHADATSSLFAYIPTYATSTSWTIGFALSLTAEPAATTILIQVQTDGTAPTWRLSLVPGAPSALQLDVLDNAGASLLSVNFALDEANYFGKAIVHTLIATQGGADIHYEFYVSNGLSTPGSSGHVGILFGRTAGQLTAWETVGSAGMSGAAFGHFVVYSDTSGAFALSNLVTTMQTAVSLGNEGEYPWARFQRLCIEEGIPYTMGQSLNQDLTMGPQTVQTLIALLDECQVVEGNLMHDAGTSLSGTTTGLLAFPARDERDNATTSLTLDFTLGQVVDGFEPTLDDQNIINDAEVSRTGGSTGHVVDQDSIDVDGRYRSQVTVNTQTDQYLRDLAGFIVNLGTLPGMRYPAIGWNLRASPELAQSWLASDLSSKLDVSHPPSQYPPDLIESFIEGYVETLGDFMWAVVGNLSPASGNIVRVLAADAGDTNAFLGRDDWDSCVLAGSPTTTATSTTVTTTPLITTTADDFPFDVFIGGERITITNCTGSSNPQTITMTRSVNTVVKAHTAGDAVTLAAPTILSL